MVRSGTPGPTATWPGTYSVHSVLLHTKLPSVAVRGFGSRFELLLLEGLVFLKHILPQLVYAWGEENRQEETGQTDVRPCFPVGQTRTGRVISADLQGSTTWWLPSPCLPCARFTVPPAGPPTSAVLRCKL